MKEINVQFLDIAEKFYLNDTIGGGTFDSIITRIKSEWCKFSDLVQLLALSSKRQIIFCMEYKALSFMEVGLGQLKRKMQSD